MKILTALDRSEYAEIVLEHGLDHAARYRDAELHFVTALPDRRDIDDVRASLALMVRDALDAFGLPDRAFTVHVVTGRAAPSICAFAQQLGADLLVIGRFNVPTESDTFVRLAPCATLVVGADGVELEPQCRDCEDTRRSTNAEQLFCARHAGDRVPDLVTRLPPRDINRLWWL